MQVEGGDAFVVLVGVVASVVGGVALAVVGSGVV